MDSRLRLTGPFKQIVTMAGLPLRGPLKDEQLKIITDGGILSQDGKIVDVASFQNLKNEWPQAEVEYIESPLVAFPGFIDAHTHIAFGGSREIDYAARNNGKTYQQIAAEGGGIWSTVTQTRKASEEQLTQITISRMQTLLQNGITTVEIKSGYGLTVNDELKILKAIQNSRQHAVGDIVATCLATHIVPREFKDDENGYISHILNDLLPAVWQQKLASRVDIFTEENAFSVEGSRNYLQQAQKMGFQLTIHGDQFTTGGARLAAELGALSVDHLEATTESEMDFLAQSDVIPMALPGASIGIGCAFTPARKLLDRGCSLAIASDWNPGSAPHGNLLTQAAILGTYEKLSSAEIFAGMTFRAAKALNLEDRGQLKANTIADFTAFPCHDFRSVLYYQGEMRPTAVWKKAIKVV